MRAAILSTVLLFGSVSAAMAQITQPVTVNVFGKSLRQIGTYTTASADIPAGVQSIGIKDTMSDQDASDPSNSFIFTVFVSPDGISWRPVFTETWQGGTFVSKTTGQTVPNHVNESWANGDLQSGLWTGWKVRAELDLRVRLSVGFDVTAYPPGFNPQ